MDAELEKEKSPKWIRLKTYKLFLTIERIHLRYFISRFDRIFKNKNFNILGILTQSEIFHSSIVFMNGMKCSHVYFFFRSIIRRNYDKYVYFGR